ncbi:GTP-binding protein, putative [Plasmodium ovale]|uniref:GTP-binding protein, putative n=2 Tax=Plasmodium ovale TaxID=36330 RepID=A0A1A8WW70_PLAOA|nr:GTP-binding protein, putative [Plasmodium ovale curtisi]SBS97209.1 GTP-binding protein, putative [Plasmodium ovale curtisi]SCP05859.1 GTP-binding protein, putative [Plasmodium ovale]
MRLLGNFFRKYASPNGKWSSEKVRTNVSMVNQVGNNCTMSRRQKEKRIKLDVKIYEQLKKRMIGKPMNKLQRNYMKEKRPKFAPIFLDQLKPRMILYKVAIKVSELPLPKYPEVAFIGRSNCGKSTLINELCGRTNKAKVSKLPGCTKEIHFYKIGKPCLLCLVDLPGYGFAHSKEELRLQWNEFTLFYLKNRKNLKKVFVLIDCRIGLKTSDKELLLFFDRYNIKYQIVLSKCDLLNAKDITIKIQMMNQEIPCFKNLEMPIIPLSSLKRQNLNELRNEIAKYQLNKTIVKNNIIMKINDLIEQRSLKKLKKSKGLNNLKKLENLKNWKDSTEDNIREGSKKDDNETKSEKQNVEGNTRDLLTSNIFDIYEDCKKGKSSKGENLSKDILISDETIFEALNRWKTPNDVTQEGTFNKYMNQYMKHLIHSIQQKFLENCHREYNKGDLAIIDQIIEPVDQLQNEAQPIVRIAHKESRRGLTYMDCKKGKYKLRFEVKERTQEDSQVGGGLLMQDELGTNNNTQLSLQNSAHVEMERITLQDDVAKGHINHSMKGSEIRYEDRCYNQMSNENLIDECTNDLQDSLDEPYERKPCEYSDQFSASIKDSASMEDEIFLKSLLSFDKDEEENHSEYIHAENVKMGNLFEASNADNKWNSHFKRMDYSKAETDALLEEDETYTTEDYVSGLKKAKKESMHGDNLYKYTFNMRDKSTHYIYEKTKSEAYKMYISKQLENLHEAEDISASQKGVFTQDTTHTVGTTPNCGHKGTHHGNTQSQNRYICKEDVLENEIRNGKDKIAHIRKNYIGLKTRSNIIKGTKKLKLFGKKRTNEILHVPTDLATDYFKLCNNSTVYEKLRKKNNWNYISSKYNKWLKKMNRKRISSEITSPVKKEDVMVRYAQKQEGKYRKEKNKWITQKKKLGMITKPPNHKRDKKHSRNFTLSDEQKMFDREAFFKYRDVQK